MVQYVLVPVRLYYFRNRINFSSFHILRFYHDLHHPHPGTKVQINNNGQLSYELLMTQTRIMKYVFQDYFDLAPSCVCFIVNFSYGSI